MAETSAKYQHDKGGSVVSFFSDALKTKFAYDVDGAREAKTFMDGFLKYVRGDARRAIQQAFNETYEPLILGAIRGLYDQALGIGGVLYYEDAFPDGASKKAAAKTRTANKTISSVDAQVLKEKRIRGTVS